ncbi:MAG: non-hydrolyzing UDP-N-acetylglucosamine 2-epimerase [Candidatus Thorarchaeota archaeon]
MNKRYALVTGTRPQIIKSVPILKATKQTADIELIHIFTGQHKDANLVDVFFKGLVVDPPDYNLDVSYGSTDYHISTIIQRITPILKRSEFEGVLVPGDTNSALAAGLSAMFLYIPVLHVESGLRSYDFRMPEELNRRLIDHGSSSLFSPTETAVNNLKKENILGKIIISGDTMYDLLLSEKKQIFDSTLFDKSANTFGINKNSFSVLTMHRRENLNNPMRLHNIFEAIGAMKFTTVFPMHPHTRKVIVSANIAIPSNIKLIEPLPYHEFLNLVAHSNLVLTDSGGLQKEAYLLNVPCVTLRTSSEWVETLEQRANVLVGTNSQLIRKAIDEMYNKKIKTDSSVYGDGNAASKIVTELLEFQPQIPTVPEI